MAVSFKIEGGADLSRRLLDLNDKLQKKILRSAVVAGAQVVKKRAKQIAADKSRDTGALIRNIAGKVEKQRSPEYVQINIGVRHGKPDPKAKRQDDPFYWWQHEFGNSKMAARPFLTPAFEETKEDVLDAMVDRVKKGLENA